MMKKQFRLTILSIILSCSTFAYAVSVNYLNFIKAKNIDDISIHIYNSCEGSGTEIPPENIATGFYQKTPAKYYLKVKANETNSKVCWNQLKPQYSFTAPKYNEHIINYFPDFPDEKSYSDVISKNDLSGYIDDGLFAKSIYYMPYYLFFTVNGTISISWQDENKNFRISTIPITFALGQTKKRKDNSWFIIGNNEAKFNLEYGEVYCFDRTCDVYKKWNTGITLHDTVDKSFCLSSNLKDNNTIKVTLGECKLDSFSKTYLK